jgi:radical SAM protein with 4Fe4S-binding SPASM domain
MKRLKKIYLEITNTCNLSCDFCPDHSREQAFMTSGDFRKITDRIRGKAETLYFHVKGEPLLHPDLGGFLDIAGEKGFSVQLTTNGTLLPDKRGMLAEKLKLARINVSLHSLPQFPRQEQEKLTRSILEAAAALAAENRIFNPRFLISLRLWTKDNIEETRNSMRLIEEYFHLESNSIEKRLSEGNSIILQPGLVIHTGETFAWPSLTGPDYGPEGYCLALRDQAAILVDGTVVPCCLDNDGNLALGNIFASCWDEILSGPRAKALYKSFTDRKIDEPLCRRCGFRTRFNSIPKL